MLFKIAWRNIWRHPTRSFIVIVAITMGLWAGVFLMSFYFGLIEQRITDVVENEVSHLQIHHPLFKDDWNIRFDIKNGEEIFREITEDTAVQAASARMISAAMAGSSKGNSGVMIYGIDPEKEKRIIRLDSKVTEGDFFDGIKSNPVLIGEKLAEKLNVKVKSKIVLTFQNADNEITAGAFRVVGFYKTSNSRFDEMNVFVKKEDLNQLLGDNIGYHEIAVLLKDRESVDRVQRQFEARYADLLVQRWTDILPDMKYMMEVMDTFMAIFILIILLAVVFGIINTMLMAILERVREIGMLMAVGMNKVKIFFMIMIETIMLTMIGVPLGFLLGYLTITYFQKTGIDFSLFSESLESFGYASIIYPLLDNYYYFQTAIEVFVLAVGASVFPAWRSLRLKPADSIRKI